MDVVAGDGMGERGSGIRSEIDELIDRLNESFILLIDSTDVRLFSSLLQTINF